MPFAILVEVSMHQTLQQMGAESICGTLTVENGVNLEAVERIFVADAARRGSSKIFVSI